MSLQALLNPSSVAIFGASQNPKKVGGRPIRFMLEQGFKGDIYPINPGREVVQGLTCYPDLASVPTVPDVAIVAVGQDLVLGTIRDCADRGVKACIVMASGFGETGEAGRAAQAEMLEVARAAGMRIVGPNSQGLANFNNGAILNFSTMFVEIPPETGPIACISQSGGMSVVPYHMLRQRGLGIGHCHATGNDADVTVGELAAEVVADPSVKLCLIYLEKLQDPTHLARAAKIARERGVPIIALKSGRSPDGQRAAQSHTGAIASEDRIVDAFFERHGIWRAEGTEALVEAAEIYLQGWAAGGRRVAVVSNSGATCVLSADAIERYGLELAVFSSETEAAVRDVLPDFAASRNPIDITAALLTDSGLLGKVLPHAGGDDGVDMIIIGIPVSGEGYDVDSFARDTAAFAKKAKKPVVLAAPQDKVRKAFAAYGIPTFETEDAAVRALAQFSNHRSLMQKAAGGDIVVMTPGKAGETLDENRSLDRIAQRGVAVANREICKDVAQALAFLEVAPNGIVLKANSSLVPHKSEHGLVRVGLNTADQVESNFRAIQDKLADMNVPFEGILAAEMVPSGHEMVVGGYLDPVFGPVVVVGEGGIAVEAMPDNRLLLTPFDENDVASALSKLRIGPLFAGVRGAAPLNTEAVFAAARGVAELLTEGSVQSVDINPLITTPQGAIAADALVEQRTPI
ncbi:CoA-binding protein [Maritimibacter sp. DP07]|uniref:CoA-binding protein n=1 Tax=Maritimibacter harenae TaxID=2606218 RepID=A0A845M1G9_9RHOB|nr:acetate--CoA ligase family protein [Maritimibacter harenae]MZR13416.1 CoA-binding protein [Maritimibacter harenae]